MVQVENLNITGEFVKNLKDKRFVVATKPEYVLLDEEDKNGEKKKRVFMQVLIYADRSLLGYFPNKKSIKTMANLYGLEMDEWVGKMFEWKTTEQDFLGMTKEVAYVKDVKLEIPKK